MAFGDERLIFLGEEGAVRAESLQEGYRYCCYCPSHVDSALDNFLSRQ